jgi:hypothetical protein
MAQTKFSDSAELEADFIAYVCRKVSGIGGRTAKALTAYCENLEGFASITEAQLLAWTKHDGTPVLQPQQAKEIIAVRDELMSKNSRDIRQLWISALIHDFVENALNEINETDFKKLLINPFLIRAFNFTDHRYVIRFCFYQRVHDALAQSWVRVVDDLLVLTGEKSVCRDLDHFVSSRQDGMSALQWASNGMPAGQDFGSIIKAKENQLVQEWEETFGTGQRSILKALARQY